MEVKILKRLQNEVKKEDIIRDLRNIEPKKVNNYFVNIRDKIYPPKQVITEVLKIHEIIFTTIEAIDLLKELDFNIGWLDKKTGKKIIHYNEYKF